MDLMLIFLILLPLLGGMLAWPLARASLRSAYAVSLLATGGQLALSIILWAMRPPQHAGLWLVEFRTSWIRSLGISFHLGLDGLSLILTAITGIVGMLAVLISRSSVEKQSGLYLFCLLGSLAAINGVFLALDLFLFYVFWELMLIPLFFLIRIWGHENRAYASIKFFIFTQAGGLLLLVGAVALYLIGQHRTGHFSFDLSALRAVSLSPVQAFWLMLAFFAAFAVKLPAVPVHSWLADAHTEAPVAGSLVLAGLVLKAGAYGMIRFMLVLFPQASQAFAPVAMAMGVVGILYGALMAFAQQDLKRLIAYTSISHMGFVLLGIFAFNALALQGAVIMLVAHAVSAAALFLLVQMIDARLGTRDMRGMGGLWATAPRMGGVMMFFVMASVGLPGLAGFVAEFLVLLGAFQVNAVLAAFAACGLIVSALYGLRVVQKVFFGPLGNDGEMPDLRPLEWGMSAALILVTLWIGLLPQTLLNTSKAAVQRVLKPGADTDMSTSKRLAPPVGTQSQRVVMDKEKTDLP